MPPRKAKSQPPEPTPSPTQDQVIPGEILLAETPIQANADRPTLQLEVINTGDRPIQVGSHYHFFEVNRALHFDRAASFGMRLNIASGNAVRFEPGQTHAVTLVALGGKGVVYGLNGLTQGSVRSATLKQAAIDRFQVWHRSLV